MHWKIKKSLTSPQKPVTRFHPVAEALLEERGFMSEEEQNIFLSPDYERDVHNPFLFSQMETVVERVQKARVKKEKIGIFGDFDADGITSSVLLRMALESLAIDTVVYLPDKLTEGHGLNLKAVEFFHSESVGILFTLDCGMMNHEEILAANAFGIDVIIVDHHHVPEVLPKAFAIINPKLKNEGYPFQELCGAGTTFKVLQALTQKMDPNNTEQIKWLLDIVAIGTVADVMPLVGENRVIVKYGLLVLSKTRNLGLQAMFKIANIDFDKGTVSDAELISFHIAPRINAASRMAHASLAHALLMAKSKEVAEALAKELQSLNTARQKQSAAITKEVEHYLTTERSGADFLLAKAPHYPYGIVGLIAGRIASTFQKPTAILTQGDTVSRGSLRSVPGFSVIDALTSCAHLLERYGGHDQAAGMQIKNKNIPAFEAHCTRLVAAWKQTNADTRQEKTLTIDMEILPAHITSELLRDLKKLAPFGEGNREPIFVLRNIVVTSLRTLGKNQEHLKLGLQIKNKMLDAIGFHLSEKQSALCVGATIDVAFSLGENIWQGRHSLQLKIHDLQRV